MNDVMVLSEIGQIVKEEWVRTSVVRPQVELDAFVVMPNHFHGVVVIHEATSSRASVGATRRVAPTHRPTGPAVGSVGAIIGQFKSIVTKRINALRGTPGVPVWQRNYYEHVVRSEGDLDSVRAYIINNPLHWAEDEYNPARIALGRRLPGIASQG